MLGLIGIFAHCRIHGTPGALGMSVRASAVRPVIVGQAEGCEPTVASCRLLLCIHMRSSNWCMLGRSVCCRMQGSLRSRLLLAFLAIQECLVQTQSGPK